MTGASTDGDLRVCVSCFEYVEESQAVQIDVSRGDEYYPRFDTVCKTCHTYAEADQPGGDGGA